MQDSSLFSLKFQHRPLPFDAVSAGDFLPALEAALADARRAVDRICEQTEAPTFANTLLALEAADEWADRICSVYFHLLNVDGGQELQALSREIPPRLSAYSNDVRLNPALFARIEALYAQRDSLSLTAEEQTALENHYLGFVRNGAALSAEDQARLREIDAELSVLGPKFGEHVLKATQAYALWIEDEALVQALPGSARAAAKQAAKAADRPDAWKFTLDMPSYIAVMTYLPDAALRREMYVAYSSRCLEGETSNLPLIRELLRLREARARLLGYPTHTAYTLERRMVGNLETLEAFYARMLPVVKPAAARDMEELRDCKARHTGESALHPWDVAYWSEKRKQEAYELDQEALRPYFEFESTLKAVFLLCDRLFGLAFRPVKHLPVYRDEVRTYEVVEAGTGREIGSLYIDPFPRPTKRPGAWMNDLLGQGLWGGEVRRPDVAIVCNFTPPVDGPSLLTLDEARTLFHEFGHALHELLSDCTVRSVAGVKVFWDFVELPSQLLENWLTAPEFLRETARHHETGEPIPEAFIERIQAANCFQKGYQALRQLTFGRLDLSWHTTPVAALGDDLIAFERQAVADLALFPPVEGTAMSPAFQHIFSGGYASGYYSYKWAEVLEADVFAVFEEKGLFDPETAARLRECILSKGGSRPPMDLFVNFRGREPDPDALLRRDGLI